MDKFKTIFVGSILSEFGLANNKGVSAAATQWSSGLIKNLIQNGYIVQNLSHVWNSTFPKGRLLPGSKEDFSSDFNTKYVKYLNIKGIRNSSLFREKFKAFKILIEEIFIPDVMLFYNAYPFNIRLAEKIKTLFPRIKLILLVLDYSDPEPDDWINFKRDSKVFDGCVFLSAWAFENAPVENKIHIDAGWDGNIIQDSHNENEDSETVFLYAGKMEKYGGIQNIVNAIKLIPKSLNDLRFEFYGNGLSTDLIELAETDSRVFIHGFVSEEKLEEAFRKADVFLSPLDLSVSDNRMVFPSKIMNYLRYQKPILASRSEGISKEYDNVLFYPSSNNENGWRSLMLEFSSKNEKEYKTVAHKSRKLLSIKTWDKHVERMTDFINDLD